MERMKMDSTTSTAFTKVLATPTSRRQALKVLTATTGVFLGFPAGFGLQADCLDNRGRRGR